MIFGLFSRDKHRKAWQALLARASYTLRLIASTRAAAVAELIDLLDDAGLLEEQTSILRAIQLQRDDPSNGVLFLPIVAKGVVAPTLSVGLCRGGFEDMDARGIVLLIMPEMVEELVTEVRQRLQSPEALLMSSAEEGLEAFFADHKDELEPPLVDGYAVGVEVSTREEAIEKLLRLAVRTGALEHIDEVRKCLLRNEQISPSGLEGGMALPHCRTEDARRLVVIVGTFKPGVDFLSSDDSFAQIIVLAIVPMNADVAYTRRADWLFRRLSAGARERLLAAKTPEEAREALEGAC